MKHWLVGLLPALLAGLPQAAVVAFKRPDLTGVVKTREGRPIAGASAFIYTAAPKLGVGFL
jgi:hypothetical protein